MANPAPIVIGFVGENANAALVIGTNWLNDRLREKGFEAYGINLRAAGWSERLQQLMSTGRVAFGYGFAGVGSVMRNGDVPFWTAFKIPFLSLMYDHPLSNVPNHIVDSPYVANCYFVADYAEAQRNHLRNPHLSFVFRDGIKPTPGSHLQPGQWKKRSITYLFAKSGGDEVKLRSDLTWLMPQELEVFHECVAALKKSAELQITDLVLMHARLKSFPRHFNDGAFARLVALVDRAIRDWRSHELVEWLKHKPALIIGDGWDAIDKTGCVAKFLPAKPRNEVHTLYADAKFIFNTNPYARDICHERVFEAIERGAVAVSDRNRFSDQNLAQLSNFISFDWADSHWREKLDARIAEIEKTDGGFDAQASVNHIAEVFSLEKLMTNILNAVEETRRYARTFF